MKTTKYMKFFLILISFFIFSVYAFSDTETLKAKKPILTTSAGQSTDVTTLNIVFDEAGIGYDYCDVPTVEMLEDGVGLGDRESGEGFHVEIHTNLDKFPAGSPYKTVIFAIGASLKGMGASGLTVGKEEKRLKNIIDYCQNNDITIIAVHIGGISKRGAPGSDNERMINAVAPQADQIIITTSSNKDGRFDEIAKKNDIPLTKIEYALELVDIIKDIFE